jgi:hypothetical protein
MMSQHAAFRRVPVPGQFAQQLQPTRIPAPVRGIIQHENEAFMSPGSALVQDNWMPTMRGVRLRGGSIVHCSLPETTPVISAFEYTSANVAKMFAGNATKLYDVTGATPVEVKSGQTSGNYSTAQIITGPAGSSMAHGAGLTYVWKYRNRLFFIQGGTMNAWYLGLNAIAGALALIPLSGAASKGGKLIFGATWSTGGVGDNDTDDKCVFFTDQGEALIFSGSDPSNINNWRQEGRYQISPPLGMNAHFSVGGDLLIMTVDGIVPLSQAITKEAGQLELAMVTRAIKRMWRDEVNTKRSWAWSAEKWDEYGGIFVTTPGGAVGNRYCLAMNDATGAFCRFVGWDATCFIRMRADMFFGTQDGRIMQADRTGLDDGKPYVAKLVGGWGMFQQGAAQSVWRQARAVFTAGSNQPFIPQLDSTVDFVIKVPTPPPAGIDLGVQDLWDQGKWDEMKWDQQSAGPPTMRNTMWRSIGKTGFVHAPIVQVTVAQQARPDVELIAIDATFDQAGVNV